MTYNSRLNKEYIKITQESYLLAGQYRGYYAYNKNEYPVLEFIKWAMPMGYDLDDFHYVVEEGIRMIVNDSQKQNKNKNYILVQVNKDLEYGMKGYEQFGIPFTWSSSEDILDIDRNENDFQQFCGIIKTILNQKEVKKVYYNNEKIFIENINKVHKNLEKSKDIYYNGYASFKFDNPYLEGFYKRVESGKEYGNYEVIEIE